jgi:hypothetical protein
MDITHVFFDIVGERVARAIGAASIGAGLFLIARAAGLG